MATRKRSKREEDALRWRALAAFVKYERPERLRVSFDDIKVDVVEVHEKLYVRVSSNKRTLTVYRVRKPDGALKRMRRWPVDVGPPAVDD
jgi:hypothetical protein